MGIGAQGVLLDRGYDAVRIAGGGELADTASSTVDQVDPDRSAASAGRRCARSTPSTGAVCREHGPRTYVTAVSQVMPGWVLALLALTLILPALVVASVDAFARARRRRSPVIPWLAWLASGRVPVRDRPRPRASPRPGGAAPDPPAAPVRLPTASRSDSAAVAVLVTRVRDDRAHVVRAPPVLARAADPELANPSTPGAAVVVCLVLSLATLALWVVNPFSALLLAPALHLWIAGHARRPAPPAGAARIALVAGGLLLPALLVIYELRSRSRSTRSAGPGTCCLLVTGGHVSLARSAGGLRAARAALAGVVGGGAEPPAEPTRPRRRATVTVRGPASYAGPGSLGGTDSALRGSAGRTGHPASRELGNPSSGVKAPSPSGVGRR